MGSENRRHCGLLVDYGGVLTSNLFDSFRAFCELEAIKPSEVGERFHSDPECRELLIGLEAEQYVFVDDLPFNLAPAASLGSMATVHHVSPEQTIDELERLFGVALR